MPHRVEHLGLVGHVAEVVRDVGHRVGHVGDIRPGRAREDGHLLEGLHPGLEVAGLRHEGTERADDVVGLHSGRVALLERELLELLRIDPLAVPRIALHVAGVGEVELGDLRWSDVDLVRGVIRLDSNKTDDPRAWAMSPDVLATLEWWRERATEADTRVLSVDGVHLDVAPLADLLRADVRRAGVTRAELFEDSATRQPIRAHDLRATFCTLSLANGKTETWVADRTGHRSSQMINAYGRQARQWSELNLGGLTPLDGALGAIAPCLPPNRSRLRDLNSRPTVYETVALPLS